MSLQITHEMCESSSDLPASAWVFAAVLNPRLLLPQAGARSCLKGTCLVLTSSACVLCQFCNLQRVLSNINEIKAVSKL